MVRLRIIACPLVNQFNYFKAHQCQETLSFVLNMSTSIKNCFINMIARIYCGETSQCMQSYHNVFPLQRPPLIGSDRQRVTRKPCNQSRTAATRTYTNTNYNTDTKTHTHKTGTIRRLKPCSHKKQQTHYSYTRNTSAAETL